MRMLPLQQVLSDVLRRRVPTPEMRAEILSYSRARGLFAGLSVGGATLRQDLDENAELYGKKLTNKEILMGNVKPPAAAAELRAALTATRARKKVSARGEEPAGYLCSGWAHPGKRAARSCPCSRRTRSRLWS